MVLVTLLVFVLALGALVGCGGSEGDEDGDSAPPPSLEEASNVVVRVSGVEGIAYSGDYGIIGEEPQIVVGDTLGDEPTEYEVEVEDGVSDGVTAFFQKTRPGGGELKAEILADDVLVVESTTYAELGEVNVAYWSRQTGTT